MTERGNPSGGGGEIGRNGTVGSTLIYYCTVWKEREREGGGGGGRVRVKRE